MANQEQLSILKQGVEVWNEWIKESLKSEINLGGANLSGFDLSEAHLSGANLRQVNFSNSKLFMSDLGHPISEVPILPIAICE